MSQAMRVTPPCGVWELADAQATRRLGSLLGRHCPWSTQGALCLYLSGVLGAGKTTLAAALLASAGVREVVRSPTYALIEIYGIGARLAVHVDLYRLRAAEELEQLGLRDYLQADSLLLIEWPEHGAGALPRADLWLQLDLPASQAPGADEGARSCRAQPLSAPGEAWLSAVRAELPLSDHV
jgi:tRNA threonylcarbamoyladenosine biosynthesis protein TsaE